MKSKIYKIHKWCGLLAGLFILLMGISGSILVFRNQIQALEQHEVWTVENSLPVSIDKAYDFITAKYPNHEVRLTRFSDKPQESLTFSVRKLNSSYLVISHPSSGQILKIMDSGKTIIGWTLDLHSSFHSGYVGKLLVLIIGLLFLTSLISGLIIYRRALLNTLLFRVRFSNRNKKTITSSLHRYVGVWALLLNILLVITGILITFDSLEHGNKHIYNLTRLNFSIDKSLKASFHQYPDFHPSYIRFPIDNKPLIINGTVDNEPFYWTQYFNRISINSLTGSISPLELTSKSGTKNKIASIVGVIHLVEFENFFIKLLFCLIGLSAPILTITGFIIYILKNKGRKENKDITLKKSPNIKKLITTY